MIDRRHPDSGKPINRAPLFRMASDVEQMQAAIALANHFNIGLPEMCLAILTLGICVMPQPKMETGR